MRGSQVRVLQAAPALTRNRPLEATMYMDIGIAWLQFDGPSRANDRFVVPAGDGVCQPHGRICLRKPIVESQS